jgi:hypothetical protein
MLHVEVLTSKKCTSPASTRTFNPPAEMSECECCDGWPHGRKDLYTAQRFNCAFIPKPAAVNQLPRSV